MYSSIDIDFDVYKALTSRLTSPEDTYNDVIRRELGLGSASSAPASNGRSEEGEPWIVKGVRFPHGTEFSVEYKGEFYEARVENGALVYDGKRYTSPSAAAMDITGTNVNGWRFWNCKLPGASIWYSIDTIRSHGPRIALTEDQQRAFIARHS